MLTDFGADILLALTYAGTIISLLLHVIREDFKPDEEKKNHKDDKNGDCHDV